LANPALENIHAISVLFVFLFSIWELVRDRWQEDEKDGQTDGQNAQCGL